MNCTQIEKLLPLFIGDDLSAAVTLEVQNHLLHCATCAAEAEDFANTRSWMMGVAPAFDEDFYAELGTRVRNEIVQSTSDKKLTWLSWLPLRPALTPALTLVTLLIIVSGLWLFQKKGMSVAEIAITPPTPQLPESRLLPVSPNKLLAHSQPGTRHVPRSQSPIPALPVLPQPEIAVALPATLSFPDQTVNFMQNAETDIAAAPQMLRIEMQTADPNIRIIWLTPRTDAAGKE